MLEYEERSLTTTASENGRTNQARIHGQEGFAICLAVKIVFQQDNCRPHTSILTRQSLWELDWEIHMNSPTYICTYEVITTRCFSL